MDLVEVAPLEQPPVCRIMDYGKHKYNLKKKQKHGASHEIQLKEVRLRPKTDDHDREIKLNRAAKFLEQGHKVQITMLFRGRERQHRDLAMKAFAEIAERFTEVGKVERMPSYDGRRMVMILAPGKATPKPAPKPATPPPAPRPPAERPAAPPAGE